MSGHKCNSFLNANIGKTLDKKFNDIYEALALCSDIPIDEIGAVDFKYYRNFSTRKWGYYFNENLQEKWPRRKPFEEVKSIFEYANQSNVQNEINNILENEVDIFKSLREIFFPKHREFYKMKNVDGPSRISGLSIEQLYSSGFVSLLMIAGDVAKDTLFFIDGNKETDLEYRSFICISFKSIEQAKIEDKKNAYEMHDILSQL